MARLFVPAIILTIITCPAATTARAADWRIRTVHHDGRWTAIAATPEGRPSIAFAADGRLYLSRGPDWHESTLYTATDWVRTVSLSLDEDDAVVAFMDGDHQQERAIVGSRVYGVGWTELFDGGVCSGQPALKLDNAGNAHVAFVDTDTCSSAGSIRYATDLTGAWQTSTALDSLVCIPAGNGRRLSLALGPAGLPRVAWIEGWCDPDHVKQLRFARWGPGWQDETIVVAGVGLDGIALEIDGADVPHIAFRDPLAGSLRYATIDGGAWVVETVDAAGGDTGRYASIALDSDGSPHIAYYSASSTSARHAQRSGGGFWWRETIESTEDVGRYISIAIDAYDALHVSYHNGTTGKLRYAHWSDCNDNGVHDFDDIVSGVLADCNENGAPDSCEVELGFADDCDENGVPDECDPDCNDNGIPDACESFPDCNHNGIPDECEEDCNDNGRPDDCDIALGYLDCDGNGVLDECEPPFEWEPAFSEPYLQWTGPDGLASNPGVRQGDAAWGDYDGDGDLDLLVSGYSDAEGEAMTRVYRHEPWAYMFQDIDAGLPGARYASVEWGDYDNDGDLDILHAGTFGSGYSTVIYRNDDGAFVDIVAGLVSETHPSEVRWMDYDNDGDLDILSMGGWFYPEFHTRVYRNDAGVFTDVGTAGLPVWEQPFPACGDYDGDGDLDVFVTGQGSPKGRIFRNDGAVFSEVDVGIEGVIGVAAWGDYDADGDLDLILAGSLGTWSFDAATVIYRNDAGVFTNVEADLHRLQNADLAWGDYDNDGDLDVLYGGQLYGSTTRVLRVLRNEDGAFDAIDPGLEVVDAPAVDWVDFDADGDLDIVVAGNDMSFGDESVTRVYESECGPVNARPLAPTDLLHTVDGTRHTFSWSPAADTETPAAGLTYNLRVGTAPGADDILSATADADTGWRRLPSAMGNVQQARSWSLDIAASAPIHWAVQSVDGARAGSPFAEGDTGGLPCPADLDGDGVVAVSDLLLVLSAWGGSDGDITGDDTTDVADLLALLSAWGECA